MWATCWGCIMTVPLYDSMAFSSSSRRLKPVVRSWLGSDVIFNSISTKVCKSVWPRCDARRSAKPDTNLVPPSSPICVSRMTDMALTNNGIPFPFELPEWIELKNDFKNAGSILWYSALRCACCDDGGDEDDGNCCVNIASISLGRKEDKESSRWSSLGAGLEVGEWPPSLALRLKRWRANSCMSVPRLPPNI